MVEAAPKTRPNPIANTKKEIEAYGERVSKVLAFRPGDDIFELVARLGGVFDYTREDLEEGVSGALEVFGPNRFKIYLPLDTSVTRDRFTIAHELGHYLLHAKGGKQPLTVFRRGSDLVEWQANWFAGSFLMNREDVQKIAKDFPKAIGFWASHFKVSTQAMTVRCKSLNLSY